MTKTIDYTTLKAKQWPKITFVECQNCGKQGQLRVYENMKKNMVIHEINAKETPFGIIPEITKSCMIDK